MNIRRQLFAAFCLLAIQPVLGAETETDSVTCESAMLDSEVGAAGIAAVNKERARYGLAPLTISPELERAAQINSEMGGGHQYVISAQCWSGYPSIESSVHAWVYEDGQWGGAHRAIVLGNYRFGGFGGFPGNYTFNAR